MFDYPVNATLEQKLDVIFPAVDEVRPFRGEYSENLTESKFYNTITARINMVGDDRITDSPEFIARMKRTLITRHKLDPSHKLSDMELGAIFDQVAKLIWKTV